MRQSSVSLAAVVAGAILLPATLFGQGMPPKQVGVIEVERVEVPRVIVLPGRAVAVEETAIRPRVGGIVTGILYRGGSPVEAGTPMFRIDATAYEAAVVRAEAGVAQARAQVAQAQAAFERTSRLAGSGSTLAEVENARSTLDQAEATLKANEAALRLAEAELSWTTVTSPIAGMASVPAVSVGDLVTAGQPQALATVTRLDPIEVDMYEPSARLQQVNDDIDSGRLRPHPELKAILTLENGRTYAAIGELVAPGFIVSTSTGAVDTRFRFENPDRRLLPGMFLRGQIEIGLTDAVLVSQSVAQRDRTGQLTAFVVVDGKTELRNLEEDGIYQHQWIVTGGLEPGDLLVADGFNGLTAGMEVVTVPVVIDEAGVTRTAPPPAAPSSATPAAE